MTTWHSGPPPSIGWWPASNYKDDQELRFWNGRYWSETCPQTANKRDAGFWGGVRAWELIEPNIRWTERWWV